MSGEVVGVWIGAILTLGIFSFLYKDNPFYKFSEALFVGVSAGYWFVVTFWQYFLPKLIDNLALAYTVLSVEGKIDYHWVYVLGGGLGVLMLLRLFPSVGWLSRWSLAFIVGTTAGLQFTRYLESNGIIQVKGTILPLIVGGNLNTTIGNLVIVVGTFCGLIYFFFSKEHKGAFGGAARVGVWFLMITFGALFGYTVMSRMSLLIGRMDYLFSNWLHLIG
ncbi:MAG: hypothetical protein JSV10_01050 [Candidatus Zixiibacteriota bacterium]|nr:MAG: hypothetical protein JSV10_01050 [candidate division Zixibacteria bacterium]